MPFTVPYTFSPNTSAQSGQVNSNFSTVIADLNSLQTQINGLTGGGQVVPQGRLTLVSGVPVQRTNVSNNGAVYYTPYTGNGVPTYNGTAIQNNIFTEQTLTLNATDNVSGNLYDVFVYLVAAVPTIGTGPAWTNLTTRSAAISLLSGFWVNTGSITLRNNGASAAVSASQATYVGTIYCNGAAQVTFNPTPAAVGGGGGNILGVYNGYNRVLYAAQNIDTTGWAPSSVNTWVPLGTGAVQNNDSISWVDGLQQSSVQALFSCHIATAVGSLANIAVNFDSPSATPTVRVAFAPPGGAFGMTLMVQAQSLPLLGYHYAQAMVNGQAGVTFGGASGLSDLSFQAML